MTVPQDDSDLDIDRRTEREEHVQAVLDRCDHQLSFHRSPVRRAFTLDELTGPCIDDAYGSDVSAAGSWEFGGNTVADDVGSDGTDLDVLRHAFTTAVREAVHEALEWFRIDGQPALDPHREHEQAIHAASEAFAHQLWALRDANTSAGVEPDLAC